MKIFSYLLILVFLPIFTLAQTLEQKNIITQNYNKSTLLNFAKEMKSKATLEKQEALTMARQKGWVVSKEEDGAYIELMRISEEGTPIYFTTTNVNASRSTRAYTMNSGGMLGLNLNGNNLAAHVWDAGLARATHQEYDGAGGYNRFSVGDGSSALHWHSAHVMGTIIASGQVAAAKGMAPYANGIGYDWNSDVSEATTAASGGMLLSNHSYGWIASSIPDWYFGAYHSESRSWDVVMYNAPYYLMVTSAGNDGDDNTSNGNPLNGNSYYDKLSGQATAKNNLVVANAQDASINSNGDLNVVYINSGSSEGPTDDLRIKPDIAGNGTSLYSTFEGSNSDYGYLTGTSMASPNVTGTLLLLQEHYHNIHGNYMRAATLKGLALHTADDAGPSGPDAVWGWGLMNGKDAANAISQDGVESLVDELSLSQGNTYTVDVTADGSIPLEVSICWTDPPGTANSGSPNNTTPVLVNDLDLRVTKGGTTYYPYRLTSITSNGVGDNDVDPFEKVIINGASGVYTITVSHEGSLYSGNQAFSLIVTGKDISVCNPIVPTGLAASGITGDQATLSWNNVPGSTYTLRYKTIAGSTWTVVPASTESHTISGLSLNTQYEAQVRSVCPDGSTSSYSASVIFTTEAVTSSSSTYTLQDIPTDFNFTSAGGSSSCPGGMNVSVPVGATITGVDVSYTMTTANDGWKSEQRSQLRCLSTGGTNESTLYAGSGNIGGTQAYSRTALTIANGVNSNGNVYFELHTGRTWGGSGCNTTYNRVDNNTWTVTVYYIPAPAFPVAAFSANILTPTIGQTVSFTDASTNSPTSWSWSFSPNTVTYVGGTSSSSQNPQLVFNALGDYTVSLQVTNPAGSDTEVKTNYISVVECSPCVSTSNDATMEWISNVTFNTINNSVNTTNGYEDFTSLSTSISLGNTYELSVGADMSGPYDEYVWAFIDWNDDCDFEDAGEAYNLGVINGAGIISQNITVPLDAVLGNTVMRISLKYNGSPTACETFDYGQVEDYSLEILGYTIVQEVDITAYLEGPFNGTDMNTDLNSSLPLSQPFGLAPWNYSGTESVAAIPNANIVDWVLIDVRDATSVNLANSSTSVERQAAFLRNDGRVVDLAGNPILNFNATIDNSLFIAVFQRNHIPVITASSPTESGGIYSYNFTTASSKAYGGSLAHKMIGSGKWGMFSGNGNADATIDMNDNTIWSNKAAKQGYFYGDYNLDTQVDNKDKNDAWEPNKGANSYVPE